MKLSLSWLKDYVDPKLSTDELAHCLTMAGLEVEGVDAVGKDTVLDLEITPNRPDCLCMLGLAREVGAITGKLVKYPKVKSAKISGPLKVVAIENKKDCSRYVATLVRDVRIAPSPQNIQDRLQSMGMRPINNAVDVTNFVLMETGQPLHVFDYDKLLGGKVMVRRARKGESIITLDGVERQLDPSILVIADAQKPVAIAGIMGGKDTQVTSSTRNILLESAHFDMGVVRRTSRQIGLKSDSSYRFERNVDWEGVLPGANRATDLLLALTHGKYAGRQEIGSKATAHQPVKISIKANHVNDVLGAKIKPASMKRSLTVLGFKVTGNGGDLTVTVPFSRPDVQQPADIVEEISRMVGFDRLPSKLPMIKAVNITVDPHPRRAKHKVREALVAAGAFEAVTYAMTNAKAMAKCNMAQMPAVKVYNPLSQDQEMMRPTLLPSLLQVAMTNINRGQKDLKIFEIGKTYGKDAEKETLGILLTGRRSQDWRLPPKNMVDIFDIKGIMDNIFQNTGCPVDYKKTSWPAFDAAGSAVLFIQGREGGRMGKVDKAVLGNWGIKNQDIYYAEVYLEALINQLQKPVKYQPICEFPGMVRDVSLEVKKGIPYKDIEAICRCHGGNLLVSVQFREEYVGEKIHPGNRGLLFSCHYQSNQRTLREDEVNAVHQRIVQALSQELGAARR